MVALGVLPTLFSTPPPSCRRRARTRTDAPRARRRRRARGSNRRRTPGPPRPCTCTPYVGSSRRPSHSSPVGRRSTLVSSCTLYASRAPCQPGEDLVSDRAVRTKKCPATETCGARRTPSQASSRFWGRLPESLRSLCSLLAAGRLRTTVVTMPHDRHDSHSVKIHLSGCRTCCRKPLARIRQRQIRPEGGGSRSDNG